MVNGRIARSVRYLLRALRHDPCNPRGYIYALALPVYAIGGAEAISSAKRAYHLVRATVWLNGCPPASMKMCFKRRQTPAGFISDWLQRVATRRSSLGRGKR
jgi:hypothetical protein